jgi:hypothetical protein
MVEPPLCTGSTPLSISFFLDAWTLSLGTIVVILTSANG